LYSQNSLPEKINEAYSSEPWWYDARGFLILTFAYRSTLPSQIRLFSSNMKSNHLEAAIGSGTLTEIILKWRHLTGKPTITITGFDYSERMLAGAQYRFNKNSNVHLIKADAAHLPWSTDSFDSVNVANAIHCFPDLENAIKELSRVLKSGGTFAGNCLLYPKSQNWLDNIATKINNWGVKKGILHKPYHQSEIEEVLTKYALKVVFSQRNGNSFDFIAVKKN